MLKKTKNILDGISIYVDETELPNYYAETYFLHKEHLEYLKQKSTKFTSYIINNNNRKEYFKLLIEAYTHNYNSANKITTILKENVTVNTYEKIRRNKTDNTSTTLKDFKYLRRDWGFSEESEKQIETIVNSLKKELTIIKHTKKNSLFIGCGVGRLAVDFADFYDKVYATDKSFSMIWHFQRLLDGNKFTFYNPCERNVHKLENVARKHTAQIPKIKLNQIKSKVEVFVSDVLDIPFQPNSINSIFSIYFTDVIALKLWFQQINNKLTDNGLFIHFGPLDYFFSDEREMLTAEEFRLFFENNGYTTLVDKVVVTPHLEDSNSISYRVYRNWFFIAQKNKPLEHVINNNTILVIKTPLSYERKGVIKDGEEESEVSLKLPSGVFNGADSVIQILKLIDGKNSFEEILIKLKEVGFEIDNPDEIKNLLIDFLKQGIISIV